MGGVSESADERGAAAEGARAVKGAQAFADQSRLIPIPLAAPFPRFADYAIHVDQ